MHLFNQGRRGFTIVEIMLVVTIIGILAMIAVPTVVNAVNNAKCSQAEAELTIIATAIDSLTADTGMFPSAAGKDVHYKNDDYTVAAMVNGNLEVADLSTPDAGLLSCTTNFTIGDTNAWRGPYLDKLPVDPWGTPYFFDPNYNVGSSEETLKGGRAKKGGGGKSGTMIPVYRAVVGSYGPNRQGLNDFDGDDIYVILK